MAAPQTNNNRLFFNDGNHPDCFAEAGVERLTLEMEDSETERNQNAL